MGIELSKRRPTQKSVCGIIPFMLNLKTMVLDSRVVITLEVWRDEVMTEGDRKESSGGLEWSISLFR